LGIVYQAVVKTDCLSVDPGTVVAVKLFTGDISDERFEKLRDRADALRQVDHPNLAKLVDVFVGPPFVAHPVDESEATERFCTHVWVDGVPLAERCIGATPEEILQWGSEVALALDHLHADKAGPFAHRDIHPRNIIISPEGHAVLIDYDTILADGDGQTRTQALLPGTRFAPPERAEGLPGAQRDDRWSLARTILYALAGDPSGTSRLADASAAAESALHGHVLNPVGVVFELRRVLDGHDPGTARNLSEILRRAGGRYRLFRGNPSYDWEISPIDRRRSGHSSRTRRLVLASGVLIIAGIAAGGAVLATRRPEHPTTTTTTKVVEYRPVDTKGVPLAGLQVVDGGYASCEAGSDSVGNTYRCFAGNAIYDPCWTDNADPSTPAVLCQADPWDREATRLTVSGGGLEPFLGPYPPDLDFPWGVQLSTGEQCIALLGAHDSYNGTVVDYACGSTQKHVLLRGVNQAEPQWTFKTAYYKVGTNSYTPGPTAYVVTAWYAIPDDGSEMAATSNTCSSSALAYAAEAYEADNNNPDGPLPYIIAQACDNGYAIMVFTQNVPPPGYTASMVFKASALGWQRIGGADYITPGDFGLPVDIEDQIQAVLSASAMNEHVAF